ncbi:choice-of-anchor J domain-containing protein [Marivirga sp.]|uniref:choice-of-anchor J domain-containing protein n=1 Tax=Marivirga sp. TaxID=2018662 RepID=UPI003DA6D7DC
MKNKLWIALLGLAFLFACEEETVNSVVSFSQTTGEITTDDLSPVTVSFDISPAAPSNSNISIIVTDGAYGETFTTDPAESGGQIDIPVSAGAESAEFSIIPNEEGILFADIEISFEIVSVGDGLSTEEFDGRFFDFTIVNNKEQGSGLPFSETFDVCGADGSGELPPEGWEQVIVAQNSFETGGFACYNNQGVTGIQANAFSPDAQNEDSDYTEVWMLTPLVGLVDAENPVLSFDVDRRFDAPIDDNTLAYGIQISTDYDGSNFESANWEVFEAGVSAMQANNPDADDIENTGELDLSAYAGQTVTIAFIYRASNARFGSTALRIANVLVSE